VKLWNVENDYQNTATLRGHEHSVSSARFLPGDDRVVSASRDQTVRIWSIATTYAHFHHIPCAVFLFYFTTDHEYIPFLDTASRCSTPTQTGSVAPYQVLMHDSFSPVQMTMCARMPHQFCCLSLIEGEFIDGANIRYRVWCDKGRDARP
jgi:WD40 repeat protein